ncbi:ASPARTATE-GLUTAMATE RACEMASE FAMILY [Salix purpurea]|uniref:ASPARTATE-GLUTAMATE RACEMASE FAMILY n=1 Tax=Salix purpurea TaxID=77065 RepID=A0A9Q0THE4_SALPP|nr:ASPARTATE-GLUTAMATE RACEMASE FAMILY [Salix purpurea]
MLDRSLAMPFHTMNPFHILGHVNTGRTLHKSRLQPVLAITPSSILLHTDESGKFPNSKKGSGLTGSDSSDSLLSQANAVGIIGGISVISASNFLKKLVQGSSQEGNDCIPFVLCSNPILNKELLSHERNSFPSLSRQNESFHWIILRLWRICVVKRLFVEKSGVRCIVMPCHISHSWHDEVSKGCSVPFLHMGECVAMELKEAKLKPLEAGSPLRIGLLATNATLTAGFYQEKLQSEGFEVVLPDKATMEHEVIPAIEAVNRKDMEGAQNLLRIALQVLLVRAVNTVILASDDMHNVLPQDDPLLKKCIDPMDALARSAIKWVQTAGKGT